MLSFSSRKKVSLSQFRDLLEKSTLGERRPLHDPKALKGMLENSNLTATCWDGKKLVGIARSVTDFHFCCYLSDLAVDTAYQKKGIGKKLIEATQSRLGPHCMLHLIAAPAAAEYYPHIGFGAGQCWILKPGQGLASSACNASSRPIRSK